MTQNDMVIIPWSFLKSTKIQGNISINRGIDPWIPAFAGMTFIHAARHFHEGGNPEDLQLKYLPLFIEMLRLP
jgi:hypothetical protein